jgi:hypothetical protein
MCASAANGSPISADDFVHRPGSFRIDTDFPAAASLEEDTCGGVIFPNKRNSSDGAESISHTICFE